MAFRQMTSHTLDASKGWPQQYGVDFKAPLSASIPDSRLPVYAGHCVRLDSDGTFLLGVGTTASMPLFLFQNSDDPDIVNDGGDAAVDVGGWVGITPGGGIMAIPAKAAVELMSTEYVAGSYPPNTHLTAAIGTVAASGRLVAGTVYTDTIVGIVSRGVVNNGHGVNAVTFWPWYIPPTP